MWPRRSNAADSAFRRSTMNSKSYGASRGSTANRPDRTTSPVKEGWPMSTTATVTPYDRERQRQLAEEEAKCQAAIERYRVARRRMRISSNRVALNVRTMEPMVRAAESLGYRLDALSGGQAPMELAVRFSLTRSSGDILVMERGESGRLVVSTNGSREIIQQVVREHVLTRAKAHLQARSE